MKAFRPIAIACFTVALVASPAAIIQADNAPVYETPQGLGPGIKNTTVRMANEQVDIQVVERGDAAIAVVNAIFTMINNGPTVQVLTGFPDADYAQHGNPDLPGGGYMFTPANITDFRAWTDTATFSPTHPTVSAGQYQGEPWFVWNMTYPHNTSLPVHVSYQQNLGEQHGVCDACGLTQYVNVIYVLRTGALWAGTIDDAHVTFEAPNGGAFVGADGASTVANDHIVWDFTNFKPASDVGTVYVFATPWKELQAAEAAANQPGAGPTDFLRAAQDAILLVGADRPGSAVSPFLAKRYASEMEQWASSASVLNTADSWKALGDADLFASGAVAGKGGGVVCWPDAAAAAYQQAADLGSDSAAQDLDSLHFGAFFMGGGRGDVQEILPSCGP